MSDEPVEGEVLDAQDEGPDGATEAGTAGDATDDPTAQAASDQATDNTGVDATDADAPADDHDARIAELTDRLARARADYANLQNRVQREATAERERVKARVLEDFLQIYEYGQMAAFEAERNPGPLADGVKMIVREFDRLLENQGVKPIGKVGEAFDLGLHEACATEAADGVEPGHVSRVVATGYKLGDRVLRHAKVAIAPDE